MMTGSKAAFLELFPLFESKMTRAGVPEVAIRAFEDHFRRLTEGDQGVISESELLPVEELPELEGLEPDLEEKGAGALDKVVFIRLNGGLGTSMGLQSPKSLLEVKGGNTFLDLIAMQSGQVACPLLLMNSYATHEATRSALPSDLAGGHRLPAPAEHERIRMFVQHQVPRIRAGDWRPVTCPEQREREWCPPGHGDIYHSLHTSALLDSLVAEGKRYAFVANADNLGAELDLRILGFMRERRIPFLMEVTRRTPVDAKGGHLARQRGGARRFTLRESAQCAPGDRDAFQDIHLHRFFNTNNLWLDLAFLRDQIRRRGCLKLPMIRNRKSLLPWDPTSEPVFQLESAMGAAIALFPGAEAIQVPRSRFAPVKTCSDLLLVRSDAVVIDSSGRLVLNPERRKRDLPMVFLDSRHYRTVEALESRFPDGPPSLVRCRSFRVDGDIRVLGIPSCIGDVHLINRSDRTAEVRQERLEGVLDVSPL
jgi:UTP--glucose-1-phosphate uridylyltransferase